MYPWVLGEITWPFLSNVNSAKILIPGLSQPILLDTLRIQLNDDGSVSLWPQKSILIVVNMCYASPKTLRVNSTDVYNVTLLLYILNWKEKKIHTASIITHTCPLLRYILMLVHVDLFISAHWIQKTQNNLKSCFFYSLDIDGTTFYKFKLPEVQINLHFG